MSSEAYAKQYGPGKFHVLDPSETSGCEQSAAIAGQGGRRGKQKEKRLFCLACCNDDNECVSMDAWLDAFTMG